MPVKSVPYASLALLLRDRPILEEDAGTAALVERLRRARRRGHLTKAEMEAVCRWKSPRVIGLVRSNSHYRIRVATAAAIRSRDERTRFDALLALHGVSVPMASAVLTLLDPKRYGVIDIRVWQLLHAIGVVHENPRGAQFTFPQWHRFLLVIREAAGDLRVPARAVERTLFGVHREYQEGTLYRSPAVRRSRARLLQLVIAGITALAASLGTSASPPAFAAPAIRAPAAEFPRTTQPLILGLDHIPVAVRNLEGAVERYRELGFAIKPGRPHENGIRNRHVKFPDGTEIELITAPEARDALTEEYRRHLARGDGPAFVAFYTRLPGRVAARLSMIRRTSRRNEGLLTFTAGDSLRYIFFGGRNHSPTDRQEHFDHENTAVSLLGVWLASDDLSAERRMLRALNVPLRRERVRAPEARGAEVAHLSEGEIVLLSGGRRRVGGRRVVGVTIRVRSLDALEQILARRPGKAPRPLTTENGRSIFVPPAEAHGLWLEFRETR